MIVGQAVNPDFNPQDIYDVRVKRSPKDELVGLR